MTDNPFDDLPEGNYFIFDYESRMMFGFDDKPYITFSGGPVDNGLWWFCSEEGKDGSKYVSAKQFSWVEEEYSDINIWAHYFDKDGEVYEPTICESTFGKCF